MIRRDAPHRWIRGHLVGSVTLRGASHCVTLQSLTGLIRTGALLLDLVVFGGVHDLVVPTPAAQTAARLRAVRVLRHLTIRVMCCFGQCRPVLAG